jgi:hypothetical protein
MPIPHESGTVCFRLRLLRSYIVSQHVPSRPWHRRRSTADRVDYPCDLVRADNTLNTDNTYGKDAICTAIFVISLELLLQKTKYCVVSRSTPLISQASICTVSIHIPLWMKVCGETCDGRVLKCTGPSLDPQQRILEHRLAFLCSLTVSSPTMHWATNI